MLKTKIFTLITVCLIAVGIGTQVLQAKVGPPHPGPKCTELLVPFNENGVKNPNPALYVTEFSESDCQQHAPYPNQHETISDADADNVYILPAAATTDNEITGLAVHKHFYHNSSEEDANYIYKAIMAGFEITLESDALQNTYSTYEHLACPSFTGQPGDPQGDPDDPNNIAAQFASCKDGAYDPNLLGGTKITRETTAGGQKITWWFGTDDASQRPVRAGQNTSVDKNDNPQIWDCDLSDINSPCRTFDSDVTMISVDQSATKKIWTATTTSRALIRDLGLPQADKFQYNDGNAWVAFEPSNYDPVPEILNEPTQNINADYYWVDIGTNTTVWKPTTTTTPICTGLEITAPGNPPLEPIGPNAYQMPALTAATFEVEPTISGTGDLDLDYRWQAKKWANPIAPEDGYFKDFESEITPVSDPFGYNPYTDTDNIINQDDKSTYYTGGAGNFVLVQAVDEDGEYVGNGCQATILVLPEDQELICKQISVLIDEYDSQSGTTNPIQLQNLIADRTYHVRVDAPNTIYNDTPPTQIPEYEILLHNPTQELAPGQEINLISGGASCPKPLYAILMDKHFLSVSNIPTDQNCVYEYSSQADDKITFTAVPDDDVDECVVDKEISAPPDSIKECLDLQIYRNNAELVPDTVPLEEPIDKLYAIIDTDPQEYAEDLEVLWTAEGGGKIVTYSAQQGSNYELVTPHMTETVDLYDVVEGTKVTAQAQDPNDPTADLDICEDSFIVETPGDNFCFALNLNPANASVTAGESVTMTANPQNENSPHPMQVRWSEVGPGHWEASSNLVFSKKYIPSPFIPKTPQLPGQQFKFSKICPIPTGEPNEVILAPAHCSYTYVAGDSGGGYFTVEAVPNNGPNNQPEPDCAYTSEVPPLTQEPYCVSLEIDPLDINLGATTNYKATATFDDGNGNEITFNEIEIAWKGNYGSFDPTPTAGPSTQAHESTFTSASNTRGDWAVWVSDVPTRQDVRLDDCRVEYNKEITIPDSPVCTDLDITPHEIDGNSLNSYTAEATFSDGRVYSVNTEWSGNNGRFNNGLPIETQNSISSDNITNNFNSTSDSGRVHLRVTDVLDPDVSNYLDDCQDTIELEPEPCEWIKIEERQKHIWCVEEINPDTLEVEYIWKVVYGDLDFTPISDECVRIDSYDGDAQLEVYAEGYYDECREVIDFEEQPPGPPELEKGIRVNSNSGNFSKGVVTLPNSPQTHDIYYQLTFTPYNNQVTTATINDDISGGFINADVLPLDRNGNEYNSGGNIDYVNGSMDVEEDGKNLPECSDIPDGEEIEHCYNGDIGNGSVELVKVTGEVTIEYKAILTTNLDEQICADGLICEELYSNRAEADDIEVEIDTQLYTFPRLESNEILVQLFCQYILTRAAGDIFLETDLRAGIDINQCSEYVSTPGIIVTPGTAPERELFKTGAGESTIFAVQHEACTAGQSGSIDPSVAAFYGSEVAERLSSQICEVKLRTGGAWQQEVITNSIEENKTRISRWEADYQGINHSITGDIAGSYPLDEYDVLHVKDGDLTMNASSLADGSGAKTLIIENGDLYINGDITYKPCNTGNCSSPSSVASLAFIVLNGNIYVDKDVSTISGVFYVQEGETAKTGQLISGNAQSAPQESLETLYVYGSVYGDIEPLLTYRRYAGDPALEQGGIVIRFDERVILNTPPGLRDVLNLSQTEVAR